MSRLVVLAAVALAVAIAVAPHMLSAQTPQPYAGLETRPIKALSGQQIADLKAGRGMGLALAAELNGYPGPTHVLELADSLALTEAQRAKMQALFESMKAETVPLGEKLIAQETDLDKRFADKTITEANLAAATQAIGATQAALRAAHLKYHLATTKVLTLPQTARYAELRGYAGDAQPRHQPGSHQH
ncbi:MAG: Spy/CpxP family protein refolding chaperone [Xanthobacteraceae bacterium]